MAYRQSGLGNEVRESVKFHHKTSAMVCWLLVGSAIFLGCLALLGGQELVEAGRALDEPVEDEVPSCSQFIIFILGWPLE